MNDWKTYLKLEYRDPEFREYQVKSGTRWPRIGAGLFAAWALCLFLVNFLYWNP